MVEFEDNLNLVKILQQIKSLKPYNRQTIFKTLQQVFVRTLSETAQKLFDFSKPYNSFINFETLQQLSIRTHSETSQKL